MNISEKLTVIRFDGLPAVGVFHTSSNNPCQFWVEYNGRKKTDGRVYDWPSQHIHMRAVARIMLRDMTESDYETTPVIKGA